MKKMLSIIPIKGTIAAANFSEIKEEIKKIGAVWQGGAKVEGGYERPERAFWAIEAEKEEQLKELLFKKLKYTEQSFRFEEISGGIGPKAKRAGKFANLLDITDRMISKLKAEHEAKIEALEALDEGDREERKRVLEKEFAEELEELEKEREKCEESMVSSVLGKKQKAELEQEVLEKISEEICFVGVQYVIAVKHLESKRTAHTEIEYEQVSVTMVSRDSFRTRYAEWKSLLGKNPADTWESSREWKKKAEGFAFERDLPPGIFEKNGRKFYNLWTGLSIEPKKGDCSKFKEFWLDRICSGRENYFRFFWKLVAFWVQNPFKRTVAPMIIGKNRVGKNFFIDTIGDLFGDAFVGLGKAGDITGRFNTILLGKVLVHAEEAHFVGESKNPLKNMITGLKLKVEGKGTNSFMVDNTLKFIFSSNEKVPVEMGAAEQRWFVLKMSENLQPDPAYFRELAKHLQEGGLSALLHELLAEDVRDFDHRNLEPGVSDSLDIKLASLGVVELFVKESIENGSFFWTQCSGGWGEEIRRDVLLQNAVEWAKMRGEKVPYQFHAEFERVCGECVQKCEKRYDGKLKRIYICKDLEFFERHFSQKFGAKNIFSD